MELESSLPNSQQPATCPYPEPHVLSITGTHNKVKVQEAEF
jgi:hypothetical protein